MIECVVWSKMAGGVRACRAEAQGLCSRSPNFPQRTDEKHQQKATQIRCIGNSSNASSRSYGYFGPAPGLSMCQSGRSSTTTNPAHIANRLDEPLMNTNGRESPDSLTVNQSLCFLCVLLFENYAAVRESDPGLHDFNRRGRRETQR